MIGGVLALQGHGDAVQASVATVEGLASRRGTGKQNVAILDLTPG